MFRISLLNINGNQQNILGKTHLGKLNSLCGVKGIDRINLDDLIDSERECTYFDYKDKMTVFKNQSTRIDFIEDIIAFANADTESDRYIIYGIKYNNGERELLGIDPTTFADSANYQQLIGANIKPDLQLDCFCYDHNSLKFGVIKISNCDEKPYVIKKDMNNSGDRTIDGKPNPEYKPRTIQKEDSWIRKGSHKERLSREDLERIYSNRAEKDRPNDRNVSVIFSDSGKDEISIPAKSIGKLPSQIEKDKITEIIERKKEAEKRRATPGTSTREFTYITDMISAMPNYSSLLGMAGQQKSLEDMSIEELEEKLSSVDKEYSHDDAYHFFEILGSKLNIQINNNWIGYIEDVNVIITIPNVDGIVVADRICKEVKHKSEYDSLLGMTIPTYSDMTVAAFEPAYPGVEYLEDNTVVTAHRREIPHKRLTNLFGKPLRIFIGEQAIGSSIVLEIKIYGKNIPIPIEKRLKLNVIRPEPPTSASNQNHQEESTDLD